MKKMIHRIRKQPEHIRRHILHVSILISAFLLIFLWIYTLGSSFSKTDNQAKISQDLKPISILKDNLVNGYQDISGKNSNNSQTPQ